MGGFLTIRHDEIHNITQPHCSQKYVIMSLPSKDKNQATENSENGFYNVCPDLSDPANGEIVYAGDTQAAFDMRTC